MVPESRRVRQRGGTGDARAGSQPIGTRKRVRRLPPPGRRQGVQPAPELLHPAGAAPARGLATVCVACACYCTVATGRPRPARSPLPRTLWRARAGCAAARRFDKIEYPTILVGNGGEHGSRDRRRPPGTRPGARSGRSRRHGDLDRQHRAAREPGLQVRLRHRHRRRGRAARTERGDHPHHLGQEGRAGVAAGVAPERVPRLADHDRAAVAQRALPAGRLPGHHLLLRPEAEAEAGEPRRSRSRDQGDLRQARRADRGAEGDGRRRGRRRVRLRLRGHHVQGQAGRAGHRLLLVLRGGARPSRPGAEVPRVGGAGIGQLLRRAQLGRLLRRLVRLHPAGRQVPDGALDLLPHQRGADGAVRADAARGRRGRHGQLPGGLHGADARREPAPRGGGRARGARRRHHQVLDRPELVPPATRTARAASTTS